MKLPVSDGVDRAPTHYQNITLELTDGRRIVATVPAFFNEGDQVGVRLVSVSDPRPMPPDMHFEAMEHDHKE